MARLDVNGLRFAVGRHQILKDVELTVPEGRCLALLGPSGCGKTTTLRAIAGFVRPTAGSIQFSGKDVVALPPHRRNVGLVFQDYALFPHMTVAENVAYGLKRRRVGGTEMARRVEEALALVRLDGFAERMPSALSGGQQQRVALARALVIEPSVLLLDEPLGALDRQLRDRMQFELKRIQETLGITTIIVTHDQEEALSLSDEIAVMFDGRIVETGTPASLYRSPRARDTMEFLGTSNVVEAVAEPGGVLRIGERLRLSLPAVAATPGETVRIGVRPERIVLHHDAPADGTEAHPARVSAAVYKGTHAEVYVDVDGGVPLLVRWVDGPAASLEDIAIGANVHVTIDPGSVIVFGNAP